RAATARRTTAHRRSSVCRAAGRTSWGPSVGSGSSSGCCPTAPRTRGVAVAADGSVFVAGTGYRLRRVIGVGTGVGDPARAGVLKFRPDGAPDATFDGGGAVSFGGEAAGFGFPPETFAPETLDVSAFDVARNEGGRPVGQGSGSGGSECARRRARGNDHLGAPGKPSGGGSLGFFHQLL